MKISLNAECLAQPGIEMTAVLDDYISLVENAPCRESLFSEIEKRASKLGFDYCAYGIQLPLPLSAPKVAMISNYPEEWKRQYEAEKYFAKDPTVAHGIKSQSLLTWSHEVFSDTPSIWEEAQAHGLKYGWAQSSFIGGSIGGMLTLARSAEPISTSEQEAKEQQMNWLTSVGHMVLSRTYLSDLRDSLKCHLTAREREVLCWTADGKTSNDIGLILGISENTVNFHLKNVISKLNASNKTSAVVRAALLGLLNR